LDIEKYSLAGIKKILINILELSNKYNKSEYMRLIKILDEHKEKLSELKD